MGYVVVIPLQRAQVLTFVAFLTPFLVVIRLNENGLPSETVSTMYSGNM